MDSKSKHHFFRRKAYNISKLRDFIHLAEKNTPLDSSFEPFPNDELGSLLNRLVEVYNRFALQHSSLTTAQARAIQERQEQIRNKKQLTQNISHELKTPISSMQGYLETIINNPKMTPEQQMDFIRKCYEQSQRLSQLLHDLSVITRMDEASELIEKEPLSLSSIVADEVKENIAAAAEKGITITNEIPSGLSIIGNKSLLQSIFHNLLDNAITYSNGTSISIKLQDDSSTFYVISFADNGIGIANEHLPRIFERFYRIDKGRSRKLGGTGLGLSIVKNAILIHGGAIQARQNEGGGMEFVFSLAK